MSILTSPGPQEPPRVGNCTQRLPPPQKEKVNTLQGCRIFNLRELGHTCTHLYALTRSQTHLQVHVRVLAIHSKGTLIFRALACTSPAIRDPIFYSMIQVVISRNYQPFFCSKPWCFTHCVGLERRAVRLNHIQQIELVFFLFLHRLSLMSLFVSMQHSRDTFWAFASANVLLLLSSFF